VANDGISIYQSRNGESSELFEERVEFSLSFFATWRLSG